MINWKQGLGKVLSHAVSLAFRLGELLVASATTQVEQDEYFSLALFLLAPIDATIVDMAVKVMRCTRKEMHSFGSCRPFESKCSSVFHSSSPLMASNPFSSISFLPNYFLHISRAPYSSQTTDSAGAKRPDNVEEPLSSLQVPPTPPSWA